MAKAKGLTPMMAQFQGIKQRHPDVLLLFRLGDFYETFFEDAQIAARELELTLTGRDTAPDGGRIPMAGIPHHALDAYLPRLLAKGYRVAIAEQMEDPATVKGLVRREVVRIVTPGTVLDGPLLAEKAPTYLAALVPGPKGRFGIAHADVSTGELWACEAPDAASAQAELQRLAPAELLLPWGRRPEGADARPSAADLPEALAAAVPHGLRLTPAAESWFEAGPAEGVLKGRLGVAHLEGHGLAGLPLAVRASGALLAYVAEAQAAHLALFRGVKPYGLGLGMQLDEGARRHLELFATSREGRSEGSLLAWLDGTRTAMGGRRLRRWLLEPLLDLGAIAQRQEAVAELVADAKARLAWGEALSGLRDVERLAGKVGAQSANPRDLVALREALGRLPQLAKLAKGHQAEALACLAPAPQALVALGERIGQVLLAAPPVSPGEGGLIQPGFHPEVDELRGLMGDGQAWLAAYEAQERARTGISSLKVGYSRAFGYHLEVTRANLPRVPADYQRRQTLTAGERFTTPELREREGKILHAEGSLHALELQLFQALRQEAAALLVPLQDLASRLAEVDVLLAFAERAVASRLVRPHLVARPVLEVLEGRHPVVEALLPSGAFVANDVHLDAQGDRLVVLTGPNMAGKSTYMRQIALLAILAQVGSFVPAEAATMGLVDRIFTRIGAVDDLAMGQSTFMVEMHETANLLRNATERSLVLLDEVGRGTSTLDGLAIAWSVAEHLAREVRCRTLFATHYHELTGLASVAEGVRAMRMLVEETGHEVVFLRKVVPGGADRSYGVEVARLAGLPDQVVARARQVLAALERSGQLASALRKGLAEANGKAATAGQLALFEAGGRG